MKDKSIWMHGHPVYIATIELQRRKHHKKRINKKWLKRYGCEECDLMPHGQAIMSNGVIWMTKRTYQRLVGVNKTFRRNKNGACHKMPI